MSTGRWPNRRTVGLRRHQKLFMWLHLIEQRKLFLKLLVVEAIQPYAPGPLFGNASGKSVSTTGRRPSYLTEEKPIRRPERAKRYSGNA